MKKVFSNSGRTCGDSRVGLRRAITRLSPRVLLATILSMGSMALAQDAGPSLNAPRNAPVGDLLNMKGVDRPSALTGVTIEQRLNSQLPLDADVPG